jgi:serine/threonine protein phosphatase 1
MIGWTEFNGGEPTWEAWCALSDDQQHALLAYLEAFMLYEELEVNGRRFLLAHAGLGKYAERKTPDDCSDEEMIWERMDYDKVYWPHVYLVTGHTPTGYIDPAYANRIIQKNNHIAIDCGAVFGGTLGCICLETLEEFYVC